MAFQMIPPRLSSSPPPLDSHPSVTCPDDDDDDEFGSFSTHNSSFDITGLSDKLPPSPEKIIGNRIPQSVPEESVQDEAGIISARSIQFSPPPPQPSPLPDISHPIPFTPPPDPSPIPTSDWDDFGDFQDGNEGKECDEDKAAEINESKGEESVPEIREIEGEASTSEINASVKNWDDFGDFQTGDEESGKCEETPETREIEANVSVSETQIRNTYEKFTEIIDGTRNPIGSIKCDSDDNDSQNTSQIGREKGDTTLPKETDEDETLPNLHLFKDSPPPIESSIQNPESDDDFGDFAFSEVTTNIHSDNSNTLSPALQSGQSPKEQPESGVDSAEQNPVRDADSTNQSISLPNEDLGNDSIHNEGLDSGNEESLEVSESKESESETPGKEDIERGVSNLPGVANNSVVSEDSGCLNSTSLSENANDSDSTVEKKSYPWTDRGSIDSDEIDDKKGKNQALGDSKDSSAEQRTDISEQDIKEDSGTQKRTITGSEQAESENFGDVNKSEGDDDSDFGDFGRANDDDELDFDDLRKKVEEGDFDEDESVNSNQDEEFGEFGYSDTKNEGFGDISSHSEDINESEKPKSEDSDDFGDFEGGGGVEPVSEGDNKVFDGGDGDDGENYGFGGDNDDDFGAFNQPSEEAGFGSFSTSKDESSADADSWADAAFDDASKTSPVLQKLEALVKKWVPIETSSATPSSPAPAPPSLRQVVESDAFVWRRLETKLESCPGLTISWANTRTHASFLTALGVDARNILFGQKWSSSVPLFAQTLSFSPLTPAKPSESSGGATPVGGTTIRDPTTPPVSLQPSSPKDVPTSEAVGGKEGASEEQIPPAKFDWTSSGLTNPLEGPAYSSSLFDLDLLLTNTNIGKGASKVLLASLEEEFLNDGGDNSSSGNDPPTRLPPAPSPLVQRILGGGGGGKGGGGAGGVSRPPNTPLSELSPEVREVVETLPDLSYMHSKVLMFPIRHHQ